MGEHTTVEIYQGDVVVITLSPKPTREDLTQNFLAPLSAKLKLKKEFSVIVDSSRVVAADMILAKTVMTWLKSNRDLFKLYLRCSSIIVTGTIIRTILVVVFRVQPPVAPMGVVANMDDAWAFVTSIEHKRKD